MMIFKTLTSILLPLLAVPAMAATHIVGGGGKGVVCDGRDEVQVLDFFEARVDGDLTIDLGDADLEPAAKVELALTRLARLDPQRSQRYRDILWLFNNGQQIVPAAISPVDDSGDAVIPDDCRLVQMAMHYSVGINSVDSIWFIDAEFWNRLTNDDKAGLILHEIIYYDALRHGHETSLYARDLVAIVSSTAMETMTAAALHQWVVERGLDLVIWDDEPAGKRFILLDEPFISVAEASAACSAVRGHGTVALSRGISEPTQLDRLRNSFIGRFYIYRFESLFIWINSTDAYPLLAIGREDLVRTRPDRNLAYYALCETPL